jgi:hypothetical protein
LLNYGLTPLPEEKEWLTGVRSWPCIPLECDFAAWLDWHTCTIALAQLMAHNIHARKSVRSDEAVVEVVRLPAYGGRDGALILQRRVPALVCDAICDNFVDVTMGSDERWERKGESVLHDEVWMGADKLGRVRIEL